MSEQSRDSQGADDGIGHRNRFGDADLADRSGPEYAWMDRVVARSRADGAPIDRQQLDRLMGALQDAVIDKLRRGYRVNLGPVMLHPEGTAELSRKSERGSRNDERRK